MNLSIKITNRIINESEDINMLLRICIENKGFLVTDINWQHSKGTIIMNNKLYEAVSYYALDDVEVDITLFEESFLNKLFPKKIVLKLIEIISKG